MEKKHIHKYVCVYIYTLGWAPTHNSGILGIYRDLNIIAITSCGHYQWVGAQPNIIYISLSPNFTSCITYLGSILGLIGILYNPI